MLDKREQNGGTGPCMKHALHRMNSKSKACRKPRKDVCAYELQISNVGISRGIFSNTLDA